jgi:hypothetical protein
MMSLHFQPPKHASELWLHLLATVQERGFVTRTLLARRAGIAGYAATTYLNNKLRRGYLERLVPGRYVLGNQEPAFNARRMRGEQDFAMAPRCRGYRADGMPCANLAYRHGAGFCWPHRGQRETEAAE